jgi:phosphocarrier protein HPr
MTTENSSQQTEEKSTVLVVQNKMGIHARPAAMIVRIANKYNSELFMEKDDEMVNGKSIMGIMMLAAGQGSKIRAIASGIDADVLLAELEALFQRKFEES